MISPLDELVARDRQRERNRTMKRQEPLRQHATMTRVYERMGDYQKDAQRLRKDGWRVHRAENRQPRLPLRRIRAGSASALIRVPCRQVVVTYYRRDGLSWADLRQPQSAIQQGRQSFGQLFIRAGAFIAGVCTTAELERLGQTREIN